MSELTLDDLYKEIADEEEAKIIYQQEETQPVGDGTIEVAQPKPEVAPIDPAVLAKEQTDEFNHIVRYLNRIAHEVEDIAAVATRMIAERRNHYNHVFEQNKPFLKDYAIEHLKRDKDGALKGKSYKSLEAGGGIFFRQKPEKININENKLADMKEFIERYLPDRTDVIHEKYVYEAPDKQALVAILQQIADAKAKEIFTNPEEISVAEVKGLEEIYNEFGIEVEDADPFSYMYCGAAKANTFSAIKSNITQAIDGRFRADAEEEIDILLEDLE